MDQVDDGADRARREQGDGGEEADLDRAGRDPADHGADQVAADSSRVRFAGERDHGGRVERLPAGVAKSDFDPCVGVAGLDLENTRDTIANAWDIPRGDPSGDALAPQHDGEARRDLCAELELGLEEEIVDGIGARRGNRDIEVAAVFSPSHNWYLRVIW